MRAANSSRSSCWHCSFFWSPVCVLLIYLLLLLMAIEDCCWRCLKAALCWLFLVLSSFFLLFFNEWKVLLSSVCLWRPEACFQAFRQAEGCLGRHCWLTKKEKSAATAAEVAASRCYLSNGCAFPAAAAAAASQFVWLIAPLCTIVGSRFMFTFCCSLFLSSPTFPFLPVVVMVVHFLIFFSF